MTLIGTVEVEVDESVLEQIIADYLDNNSYMTHSGVTDVVEEHIKDNLNVSGEIDEYLSGQDYQTESQVQQMIDDMGFLTDSEVRHIVDERSSSLDEDDVERIVQEVLDGTENEDLADLERRFEMYAARVDEQGQMVRALNERIDQGGEKASEPTVQALLEANAALVVRIEALEQRQEIFAERLGDARVGDALTLMDLLRRAAAILGIGGRA